MKVFSKLYDISAKIQVGKNLRTATSSDKKVSAYKNPVIPKLAVKHKGRATSVLENHVTDIISSKANRVMASKQ